MTPACVPLRVERGATFRDTMRIMQPSLLYRPVTTALRCTEATELLGETCNRHTIQRRHASGYGRDRGILIFVEEEHLLCSRENVGDERLQVRSGHNLLS